jgi:putative ABC transport system ATP-binding protein
MILEVRTIEKSYTQAGAAPLPVIAGIDFSVERGDTVAITGPSGSGKTTLLSLLAGLERPDAGQIILDGVDLNTMNEDRLARFRAHQIGIIFQQFHLMPHLTAEENVRLPLEILRSEPIGERAREVLGQVGLTDRRDHLPGRLSGGECQRVAIARAMATRPALLLADEPTGNLDLQTGRQVVDLLFELVKDIGMTLILVTHNPELSERCSRQLRLAGGRLQ